MTETPIDSAKPPRSQRTHLVTALMAIGLFVLLLVPRLADLDALITPDEPLWVQRSAAFYGSLADGSFDHPDRAVHPGVMVMWSSVPVYGLVWNEAAGYLDFELEGVRALDETQLKLAEHGELLIDLLVDLRRSLTVFSALVMIALFFCLIPLIGRWQAAVAVAFVGFDPLHIGFTRLLHLDGVSANLMLVVIVAWCAWVMRGDRRWLILSGIATGMAIITRSVNLAIPGIIGLFILIEWLQAWRQGGDLRREFLRYLKASLVWGGVALVTAFALWPGLWTSPFDTIEIVRSGLDLASSPHSRQVLWRGEVITSDPGWLYYPIVLVWRISPLTLIGVVLAGIAAYYAPSARFPINRRLALYLAIMAGSYIVALTFAAKKLDRYLLPSLLALDLLAILGWIAFAGWIASKLASDRQRVKQIAIGAAVVVLVAQGAYAAQFRPFYIDAATPLLGGTDAAARSFSFGWGEGGKEIAAAVKELPDWETSRIIAGPWPVTISGYLPITIHLPGYSESFSDQTLNWLQSDYVIVTSHDVQRQLYAPEILDWFERTEPVKVVERDGEVIARIYDIRGQLPDAFLTSPESPAVRWGNDLIVLGYDLPSIVRQGRNARIHLYFTAETAVAFEVNAQVVSADGEIVGENLVSGSLGGGEAGPLDLAFSIELPPDLPEGEYTVRYSVSDSTTGQPLTPTRINTGEAVSLPVELGTFPVEIVPEP